MTAFNSSSSLPQGPPSPTADASRQQLERREFIPPLPSVFSSSKLMTIKVDSSSLLNNLDKEMNSPFILSNKDADILRSLFPNTIDTPFVQLVPDEGAAAGAAGAATAAAAAGKPLKIGVVLSGGQAAGGHNVICGIYDYINKINKESILYGFLGGPHGVYTGEYIQINKQLINKYRNMGGFDIIKSGRHKIETQQQKQSSYEVCRKLDLDGLVVIGGDDSNTNAAILGEYFSTRCTDTSGEGGEKKKNINVIGCPKTIDGDLKNYYVEISFGFDSACKSYSCSIGNLMMQTLTQRDVYQFVRLMGRSASLITLECALRCHPNMTFIGEEVQEKKQSLKEIVSMTADLVESRAKIGKHYGVILLPEGLIEFIPEVGVLIQEINNIVAAGEFDRNKLTKESREVLDMLPMHTQQQLLLDRDPHGNVQVALIHTEQLLLELTTEELKRRGFKHPFNGKCTYLGYEGRSCFPSDFDATYCYALGNVAAALIQNNVSSCMAVLKGMSKSNNINTWIPAGIPLTKMMNLENRKGKTNVPVIKKFLVDINKPLFKAFEQVREAWKILDLYLVPGPMQLNTKEIDMPYTLTGPPCIDKLLPAAAAAAAKDINELNKGYKLYFNLLDYLRTPIQIQREDTPIEVNKLLINQGIILQPNNNNIIDILQQQQQQQQIKKIFPKSNCNKGGIFNIIEGKTEKRKVGVLLVGDATPGMNNILIGIMEKVEGAGGEVYGVLDGKSFTNLNKIKKEINMQKNLNCFPILGRTVLEEQELIAPGGLLSKDCWGLDVIIILGGTLIGSALLGEYLLNKENKCIIINVAGSADFCMQDPSSSLQLLQQQLQQQQQQERIIFINEEKNNKEINFIKDASGANALGFDTQTKAAAELVGNLMTDSNSATKYYYLCQVGGGRGAEGEVCMQTHPNILLLSSACANLTPKQIAEKIAEGVAARSAEKKNFGVILLNEDLFITNKALRSVAISLCINKGNSSNLSSNDLIIFNSFPSSYQQLFTQLFNSTNNFPTKAASFPILNLLAAMVSDVLKEWKSAGKFNGSFAPICFNLSDQVRGSLPSSYDCSIGYTLGLICGSFVVSSSYNYLSNAAVFINNAAAAAASFSPYIVPLSAAAIACGLSTTNNTAAAGNNEYNLAAAAAAGAFDIHLNTPTQFAAAAAASSNIQKEFLIKDTYLNIGPIQFAAAAAAAGAADTDRINNYLINARK